MPSSLHKILIHGAKLISNFWFPIGHLSEEASESRNKYFRKYRECRSRRSNRTFANEDILHNLLLSSDPYITDMRSCDKIHSDLTEKAYLFCYNIFVFFFI